jgi:small subunit ribosomal protein S17
MATGTAKNNAERSHLRTIQGVVAGAKANKTIKVVINYQTKHPKYGKYLTRRSVMQVHDEKGEAREGDVVEIAECRPMSKTKHHRLVKIVSRGNAPLKAEEPSDVKV